MKVAVTGATGFVGRHVVAALNERALAPVLLTRSGRFESAEANRNPVQFDLLHPPQDAFEQLGKPDVLIHLAWGGLPNYASAHHFETELPAHYRFLKQLIAAGLKTLLVTGTCLEYGMQSGALSEEMHGVPTTAYGMAKNALRQQLQYLQRTSPFHLTWCRLFYVFGAGQSSSSLYSQMTTAIDRGDASFDMSAGEQLRDYLPIEDAARYLVSLATNGLDNGVVNVCSGEPVSVRTLVERWAKERGSAIRLNLGYYPYPSYEPLAFWGNPQKLRACSAVEGATSQVMRCD